LMDLGNGSIGIVASDFQHLARDHPDRFLELVRTVEAMTGLTLVGPDPSDIASIKERLLRYGTPMQV
jgi:hypothetical protein